MKKNLRRIPKDILTKIGSMKTSHVVAGCAVKFRASDIAEGALEHLGVELKENGISFPPHIIPPPTQGKFSSKNVNGIEIRRDDLPLRTHYHPVETPNWGDSYRGTHTVLLPYKAYPVKFDPPREIEVLLSCSNKRPGLPAYVIAFKVNEILHTKARDFKTLLFENLNLLQENVGACGVEAADADIADYSKSLHVSWEILPPGSREETIDRIFHGKQATQEEKDVAGERYDFFMTLKPQKLVFGSNGFRRYFGALVDEDLVVFENVQYGNAVYVLFEEWEELSKRSRLELLSGKYGRDFERVIHRTGWKGRVRALVASKRADKKKQ